MAKQNEEVAFADEFTREEVHSNYNIWSGSRDWTVERQKDYYHKGWNYGGTQVNTIFGSLLDPFLVH